MEKYLRQCIDSLVNQTLKDIEIILVNDGSTDSSLSICREYEKVDNRIKVVDKSNGGAASARNAGCDIATGKYLGNVDPDDWVELDMYEKMFNIASKYDVDIVICDMIDEYKHKSVKAEHFLEDGYYNYEKINAHIYPYLVSTGVFRYGIIDGNCHMLLRREIITLNSIRFFEEAKRMEDYLFMVEYLLHTKSIYYLKGDYFYHHRKLFSSDRVEKYYTDLWDSLAKVNQKIWNLIKDIEGYNYKLQWAHTCILAAKDGITNEINTNNKRSFKEKVSTINLICNYKDLNRAIELVYSTKLPFIYKFFIWCLKKKYILLLYCIAFVNNKIIFPARILLKK
jgi:glycosyltransferase involved in cell wall biosynthesis